MRYLSLVVLLLAGCSDCPRPILQPTYEDNWKAKNWDALHQRLEYAYDRLAFVCPEAFPRHSIATAPQMNALPPLVDKADVLRYNRCAAALGMKP